MIVKQNKKEVEIKLKNFEWIKLQYLFENYDIQYSKIKELRKEENNNIKWRFANDK